jgi:hypothetical protein
MRLVVLQLAFPAQPVEFSRKEVGAASKGTK